MEKCLLYEYIVIVNVWKAQRKNATLATVNDTQEFILNKKEHTTEPLKSFFISMLTCDRSKYNKIAVVFPTT